MARLVLALAVLGSACSTTIGVERPFASDRLAEVNSMLAGKNATLAYASPKGEQYRYIASEIALTPEKARWTAWESDFARTRGTPPGRPVEAPIDAVRNITLCDASCRAKGALEGAGFGLLVGILLGGIWASYCHGEYCVYTLLFPPLVSVPIGTLLGLGFGHRTNVEFEPVARR